MTDIKRGDFIRENRRGSQIERVMDVRGNIIETYRQTLYHVTKVVKIEAA